jgi:hypothetical protein
MLKSKLLLSLIPLLGCASLPCETETEAVIIEIQELKKTLQDPTLTVEQVAEITKKIQKLAQFAEQCGLKFPHEDRHASHPPTIDRP